MRIVLNSDQSGMNLNFIRSKKAPKFHTRPKPRTQDEISLSYNKEAVHVGHKLREIQELRERIEKLEAEILNHVLVMRAVRYEAATTPPAPKPSAAEAPQTEEGAQ